MSNLLSDDHLVGPESKRIGLSNGLELIINS